jgi:hypothetical protein
MPGVYKAHIHTFEVREKKPKGLIEVFIHNVDPGSHFPAGSFQTFKLDEDSDQSFAGMAAICAAKAGSEPHIPEVVITVESGAEDEIDSIKITP